MDRVCNCEHTLQDELLGFEIFRDARPDSMRGREKNQVCQG